MFTLYQLFFCSQSFKIAKNRCCHSRRQLKRLSPRNILPSEALTPHPQSPASRQDRASAHSHVSRFTFGVQNSPIGQAAELIHLPASVSRKFATERVLVLTSGGQTTQLLLIERSPQGSEQILLPEVKWYQPLCFSIHH
jgi:hypothetical protein